MKTFTNYWYVSPTVTSKKS